MTAPSPKTNGNRVKTNAPNSPKNSSTAGGGGTNVRVVGRIRPLAGFEKEKGCKRAVSCMPGMDDGAPQLIGARDDDQKKEDGEQQTRWFELDAVFDETSTQQDVYVQSGAQRAVRQDLFRGFNCTILAYGQTGAGKTFTMGTANASGNNKVAALGDTDGVIPRCCVDLFRTIATKCDHRGASVELSYLEVYNEEIRDLLAAHEKDNATLRIRETPEGEVYVRGLQSRKVAGPADIGKLMEEASGRRVVASTKMNATSSRSHAICILRITGILAEDSSKFSAKLTLVDLAGSERIKKTGAGAARAKEGININKGLFVLGQVVSALSEQRPKLKRKPPYRDSKLTRLLQDSLGGNSRTIMVACVSPADFNLEESVNTLRYATTARNIKNTATRNVQKQISPEEFAKLQRENQLLKKEVAELQATIEKMQAHVSQEDLERSVRLLNEFSASQSQLNVNGTGTASSSFAPPPPPPPPVPPAPSLAPAPPAAPPLLMSSPLATNKKVSELDGAALMSPSTAMEKEASLLQKSPVRSPNNRSLQSLLHLPDSAIHQANRRDSLDSDGHDEVSLSLEQVMGAQMMQKHGSPKPTTKSSTKQQPYNTKDKTREELELEVARLTLALDRAEHDVRSSLHESAVELPAAKMQLAVLEEELNASQMMASEAVELQREVQELTADAAAARAAADQLSKMVSNSNHGSKTSNNDGNNKPIVEDRLERQLRDFERLKSEESWVTLIVQILRTFKEEMRLLGDYFHMVVKVVDSKDVLSMVPQSQRKRRNKWFDRKSENEMEIQLRKKLMSEHVQFYNARFLEMEDDVSGRSEFVDAILQGLCGELDAVEKGLLAVEDDDEEKEEDINDDENNGNYRIQDRIDRIAQKQDRDSGELLYQLTKLLAGPPRERGVTDSTDAHLERHYQNNHNHNHNFSSSSVAAAASATAEAGAAATAEAKEVLFVDEETTTTTAATKTTTTAAETTEADEAEVTEAAETPTLTAEATAAEATPAEATAAEATAAEATISEAEATPAEASSAGETTNSEVAEATTTTPPAEATTSVAETAPAEEEEETTTAEEETTTPAEEEEEEATTASGAETTSPAEAATATASPSAASRLLQRWR